MPNFIPIVPYLLRNFRWGFFLLLFFFFFVFANVKSTLNLVPDRNFKLGLWLFFAHIHPFININISIIIADMEKEESLPPSDLYFQISVYVKFQIWGRCQNIQKGGGPSNFRPKAAKP